MPNGAAASTGESTTTWSRGWAPIVILPSLVLVAFPAAWPRWAFMWTLSVAIYVGCKWLTWRRTPAPTAPLWKHVGYLLAWPGMDAAAFLGPAKRNDRTACSTSEWLFALAKLTVGLLLMWGAARFVPRELPVVVGWVGMIGMVMILHFGLFHLLSCGWRTIGVEARPLMNWPLASRSVSEFWGVRWNTAFRDLTHRFLFRPQIPRLGAKGAVLVGFLASGLVHDLVISVPAGGGYGGPTVFFLVQGCAIMASRTSIADKIGLRRGSLGWSFTMLTLLLPAFLLFHPPFVHEVILPFMEFIGAVG